MRDRLVSKKFIKKVLPLNFTSFFSYLSAIFKGDFDGTSRKPNFANSVAIIVTRYFPKTISEFMYRSFQICNMFLRMWHFILQLINIEFLNTHIHLSIKLCLT